jgi:hypothetical protein
LRVTTKKDDLKESLRSISAWGIEHLPKKLPPRYAEGVEPSVTAKPRTKKKLGDA